MLEQLLSFARRAKGPLIAHISDTRTDMYPLVEEFLGAVRPRLVIHTGDMADEYKAGRIPEHVDGYLRHLPRLLDILTSQSDEVWVVPGNNDILSRLQAEPDIRLIGQNTRHTFAGWRLRLAHYPIVCAPEAAFVLYGHVENYDMHRPWQNPKFGSVYLNALFEWSLIDTATGQYCQFPVRTRPADKKTGPI